MKTETETVQVNPVEPDVVATVTGELLHISSMFSIPEAKVLHLAAEVSLEYDIGINDLVGVLCAVANAGLLKPE